MKFGTVLSLLMVSEVKATLLNKARGEKCKNEGTQKWTCELLSTCPQIGDFRSTRPDLCGFIDKEPIICCPPKEKNGSEMSVDNNTTIIEKQDDALLPNNGASDEAVNMNSSNADSSVGFQPGFPPMAIMKCVEYEVKLCISEEIKDPAPTKLFRREVPTSTLKYEFNLAPAFEFPFMAMIGFGDASNISWKCEGSIISETWILSAAHCARSGSEAAKWTGLGTTKINSELSGFVTSIKQILIHPLYKEPAIYHDIALFQNKDEVVFNAFERPMCISALKVLPRQATTTNWITDSKDKQLSILQKAELKISNPQLCEHFEKNSTLLPRGFDNEIMFCAGDSIHDNCEGDSGGPLFYKSSICLHVQLGILSHGRKCGDTPGIYTKLSYYVSWIEKIVWAQAKIDLPGGGPNDFFS